MIDADKVPFMFSVGTKLAYKIAKRYYGNIHYVWCTFDFNNKRQPPTSNPLTIAKRWISIAVGTDRHVKEIEDNKAGILAGAMAKYNAGIINATQRSEIEQLVSLADYEAFCPVLYVIDTKKVAGRSIEVDVKDRASDHSVEYKVIDLAEKEFQLIDIHSLIRDYVEFKDRKAGE